VPAGASGSRARPRVRHAWAAARKRWGKRANAVRTKPDPLRAGRASRGTRDQRVPAGSMPGSMAGRWAPEPTRRRIGPALRSTPRERRPVGLADSSGQARCGNDTIALSADVAQLVERVHGKDEVKGSSPFVGSRFLTATSPRFDTIFVHGCPLLSTSRGRQIPSTGVKYGALPRDRAPLESPHGKEGVIGSSPMLGLLPWIRLPA
jgi:hypothetical protein